MASLKTAACEIVITGLGTEARSAAEALASALRAAGSDGPGRIDIYLPAPESGNDPLKPRETAPDAIVIVEFDSRDALARAMLGGALGQAIGTLPEGAEVIATGFDRFYYPVPDSPGTCAPAPISYVVRYHRPAEDEAAFRQLYIDSHPPVQAALPGIRAILCYLPLDDLAVPGVARGDYLIGNEVAFDAVADFNAAMLSPARHELRAHYDNFPPFSGRTSHVLMQRHVM
ncbi:MAG: hypothetical protein JJT95_03215 [Pararhodobacter sp.]|nr:hypothetical protein [Pararhodobacter sp.]